MDREKQLQELFHEWKEVHRLIGPREQEKADYFEDFSGSGKVKNTFPNLKAGPCEDITGRFGHCSTPFYHYAADFYLSFCRDGFLASPVEGRKTILYICREANITPEVDQPTYDLLYPNTDDRFWMKEQYDAYLNGGKEDRYIKFIRKTADEYGGMDKLNLAYMNLNKRGGFSGCDMGRIGDYVDLYKPLICQEIEIIDPDVIICGGTYGTVLKYGLADGLVLKLGEKKYARGGYSRPHIWKTSKSEIVLRDFCHPSRGVREKKKNAINLVTKKPIQVD